MFVSDDIAAFLEAMGDDALKGTTPFKVDFHGPFETIDYRSGDIVSSEPYALANPADVTSLALAAGNSGSTISVMGKSYRITAMESDESGFTILHLGKP